MTHKVPARGERGFTLVELVAAVAIEAIIMGALAGGFVTVMRGSTQAKESFGRTGDARLAAHYIIGDARNSSSAETSTSDTSSCADPSPPVAGTATAVVRFNWSSTGSAGATTANTVNYVLVSHSLLRRVCRGGTLVNDRAVASNVQSVAIACTPTANCSGTNTAITATVTSVTDSTGQAYTYSLTGAFQKEIGTGAPPDSATLAFLTGIESGAADPSHTGVFTTVSGATTATSSVKRNGVYALQVAPTSGAGAYAEYAYPSTGSTTVARFAISLSALPSGDRNLMSLNSSAGNPATLAYQSSTQKLGVRWGTAGTITAGGSAIAANTWYQIDLRVSFGASPRALRWRIGGADQATISSTETASTGSAVRLGTASTGAYTAYVDDISVSQTSADYPLGDGKVLGLSPNAAGTNNTASNFATDSGAIASTTYQKVDEIPATTTADYIKQTTSSSTSYIEVNFADPTSGCIDGVSGLVGFASSASGSNNGKTRVYDGSTTTQIYGSDMGTGAATTLDYGSAIVTPTASSWTMSSVSGLTARVGYSTDVSPNPYWEDLLLEYDVPATSTTCDLTPPTISTTTVGRSDGGGWAGRIRQGTGYYVYANATDPGSPSSGIDTLTADVSDFDSGVTAAVLTTSGGPWTIGAVSYAYRSSVLTANTPLVTGSTYPYDLTATDGYGNSTTDSNNPAVIERYSSVILASSGLLGYWQLNDGSTTLGTDSMTGSTGTTLASHTGELGATWTAYSGNSTTSILTNANRLRRNGTSMSTYRSSTAPASANYFVSADVYAKTLLSNDSAGVIGRGSTSADTYYIARYNTSASQWELQKSVSGTVTALESSAATLTAGSTYRLQLAMHGTTIELLVNGTLLCNVTDSSISTAGRAGIRFGSSASSSISDTTGLQLDNWSVTNAPTAADSQGTNVGDYYHGTTLQTAGALVGDTDTAASFDGTDDYVVIDRQIGDDFSVEFWFESTVGQNPDQPWWHHSGLVDAEVEGAHNDFGVTLRSDGVVIAGTGGTVSGSEQDIDVTSAAGYNDGNWHHVVFTRKESTGLMSLYVDGSLADSGTATKEPVTLSPVMRFGSITSGYYKIDGSIDDVSIYDTVITATTVTDHWHSGHGA